MKSGIASNSIVVRKFAKPLFNSRCGV